MMAGDTGGGLSPLDHALNAMLLLAHVALIRGDQVGLLAFSDRVRAYVPPGGGARRIKRLVHSVHNVFPELVEPRYDRAFIELEKRCRKRSLVVLLTNLFDDVNAQIVAEHLGNLAGRHLPLGVFLRDHDLFALADHAPAEGPGLFQGAAAADLLNWRERALAGLRQPRRPDPRRLPRRPDRPARQPVPPDQGPAPALTRALLAHRACGGLHPWTPIRPPARRLISTIRTLRPRSVRGRADRPSCARSVPFDLGCIIERDLVDLPRPLGHLHRVAAGRSSC